MRLFGGAMMYECPLGRAMSLLLMLLRIGEDAKDVEFIWEYCGWCV